MNKEFLECARKEIERCVCTLNHNLGEAKVNEIADNLLALIDWSNSALMHKGFYFITASYLKKEGLLEGSV